MKKYKLIGIIFIVLISIIFLMGFYYCYQISPVDRDGEKIVVEIKGGSISSIGDTLYENGLIRDKLAFKIYVKLNGVNNLKASRPSFWAKDLFELSLDIAHCGSVKQYAASNRPNAPETKSCISVY